MQVSIESNLILFKNRKAQLVLAQDITERLKFIEAIEKQNIQFREIAWIQSHIVRAPLARMLGIVSLISDIKMDSSEYDEWVEHFTESASELDNIIKDIVSKAQNILEN